MARFNNVNVFPSGTGFSFENNGVQTSAKFDLFLIQEAWNRGANFEDLADGFGKGKGTMGGDWSGIRDSSDQATAKMLERALNFLFPGPRA